MPGPIQSGISGILTTAAGAAVAGKHLANEEEARLADLEQLRADTAEQLATEENKIRKEIINKEPTEEELTWKKVELANRDYERQKKSFGKADVHSEEDDYYNEEARESLESEKYDLANAKVAEYYLNPARALQKEFAEGNGDKIFTSKQKYLAELAKRTRESANNQRRKEKEALDVLAENPHAMSDEDEADAQEYFRQQNEKEADE